VKAVALTPLGAKTKDELSHRLYQPPEALLTLDRDALEGLIVALEKIRASTADSRTGTSESRVESA
jgi:hypothetical protein